MNKTLAFIHAFRLRTLPLAVSSTLTGSFLAVPDGKFRWEVFILSILTTIFLQVLSNLANDYGDSKSGVDNKNRVGPERAVQSGKISLKEMKTMVFLFVTLSLISGILLIIFGLNSLPFSTTLLFLFLGLAAIGAAIKYTVGKNPYGYSGLGDLFVFVFFGIVGVYGTYYLHTNEFNNWILLPAAAIGFFSVGVLNLNNMRDIDNDAKSGKKTLVVRMGFGTAKWYHLFLLLLAILMGLVYNLIFWETMYQLLFLITLPFLFMNIKTVFTNKNHIDLNTELKKLALTTFAFSLTFGLGLIL